MLNLFSLPRWVSLGLVFVLSTPLAAQHLERVSYNHPGLVVDLGVGLWAWPLPMDYDGDGDFDLVVSCPDKPSNGTYFFENPGGSDKMPVFKKGVKIGHGLTNVQVSYLKEGTPLVMTPGVLHKHFREKQYSEPIKLGLPIRPQGVKISRTRASQWKLTDLDSDGKQDVVYGLGIWDDYGWDDGYTSEGTWKRGPLHGYLYWHRNTGTNENPHYEAAQQLMTKSGPLDVFGMPSPNVGDFDNDGDLDILCGEFTDGFTYFENKDFQGTVKFEAGRKLPIQMELCMIVPTAIDWDADGDLDLIVGEEDGRVAFLEHTGKMKAGVPQFIHRGHFQQKADDVKFGALVTPVSFDWDNDGDEDLICGNTAGFIGFIENMGGNPPKWNRPVRLKADGKTIRFMAGKNGSIQGPCERKWGYTTLSVADWNHDELPDLIVNSIWGKIEWYQNIGTKAEPKLRSAQFVQVDWKNEPPRPAWTFWKPAPNMLATQWRTTPLVIDWNRDGLNDLISLDQEGYLSFYERMKQPVSETKGFRYPLKPGRRIFFGVGPSIYNASHGVVSNKEGLLRLNDGKNGRSGRRKLCLVDWDRDGRWDLLVNSRQNVNLLRNKQQTAEAVIFEDLGALDDRQIGAHSTSPTVVDWNKDGKPELLVGAEDGYLYYQPPKE